MIILSATSVNHDRSARWKLSSAVWKFLSRWKREPTQNAHMYVSTYSFQVRAKIRSRKKTSFENRHLSKKHVVKARERLVDFSSSKGAHHPIVHTPHSTLLLRHGSSVSRSVDDVMTVLSSIQDNQGSSVPIMHRLRVGKLPASP